MKSLSNGAGRRFRRRLAMPLAAVIAGLACGLLLHLLAVTLRDHGPSGSGWSLQGNGATVVLPLAAIALSVGAIIWFRRRAWFELVLWPLSLFAGLFVVLGGF